ncbi:MAG: DUF5119 domain-containing protein [Rikenellaceae bacterium]|nr:DUF5119 domain-containing protein [Rikenellaceae bacterium]
MKQLCTLLQMTALLGLALLFAGCNHKELCEFHPHEISIRVVFDWVDAPDADPKGMCVCFYPLDGGSGQRFDFPNRTGGTVQLRVGKYRILCFNNDTEANLFYNSHLFDGYGVYTREGHVLEPIYGNSANFHPMVDDLSKERVVITPDMMWGCSAVDVEVRDDEVCYTCVPQNAHARMGYPVVSNEQVITLYPHEMVCTYTYEVRNVSNLKHVVEICGSLSGMAGEMLLASEQVGREAVTLPFESVSDGVSTLTGKFYTFGHHPENSEPHAMTFYVVMDDGSKLCYTGGKNLDVTEQVHEAPDFRHVHLIIDGLDLPQPIENGHGFRPVVDDWGVVEEDIIL